MSPTSNCLSGLGLIFGRFVAACFGIVVLMGPANALADDHQVCLNFDLGPQLWDASPRTGTGEACTADVQCETPGLTQWQRCLESPLPGACSRLVSETDYEEDRGRTDEVRPFDARGWLFRVVDSSNHLNVLWGWLPLDDVGCTEVFDSDVTDYQLEWRRWSVSPDESSILGYSCQLANADPMETELVDGTCLELGQPFTDQEVSTSGSADCGGSGEDAVHCTLLTIPEGVDLDPIDYNLWSVTTGDSFVKSECRVVRAHGDIPAPGDRHRQQPD